MPECVDHAAIKTGQALTIVILAGSFLAERWEPVAVLAAVFLLSGLAFNWGPFTLVYRFALKPLGLVKPDPRTDNVQPHRFGQIVGAISAAAAVAALYFGHATLGWSLVWVLITLTALSFLGWCIGCFLYYQLNRLGLKGFFGKAPTDRKAFFGARPRKATE